MSKASVQVLLVAAFAVGHLVFYGKLRRHLKDPTRGFASSRSLDLDPDYFTESGQALRRAYSLYAKLGAILLIVLIVVLQALG